MEMKQLVNKLITFVNPKNKLHLVLELLSYVFFALTIFSVPSCNFKEGLQFVTWICAGLFILDISLLSFFFYKVKIDLVNSSLALFCLSAVLSTALNNAFSSFAFTPILLAVFTAIVYTYCVSNSKSRVPLLATVLVGLTGFLALYLIRYTPELIKSKFSRLGTSFGDINDIALFFALGAILGLWFLLKSRKIYLKIILGILTAIFVMCGFLTASKIFLLEIVVIGILAAFMFTKKDKWWLVLVIIGGIVVLTTIFLFTPFGELLRNRIANMIKTFFNPDIYNGSYDVSTLVRFNMFEDGMTMFFRKPLFGYGVQGFFRASTYAGMWSHNNISETLCSFGLVGTILFHFGLAYSFTECLKKENKNSDDNGFLMLFVFYLISMITVAFNSEKIYAFIIGICIANYSNLNPIFTIRINKKEK